jgi:hypothetical protein
MNPSADTQIIYPHLLLLLLSFHSEQAWQLCHVQQPENNLVFPHTWDLLASHQEHLAPKQSSEVKHLLKEYEGLFAASDSMEEQT